MDRTQPLTPYESELNEWVKYLAPKLASAFGYSLQDARKHIRNFYIEYDRSEPERRKQLQDQGVEVEQTWTAASLFGHDGEALILDIGYRLAGGDTSSVDFSEWRTKCWSALEKGERVPDPEV